MGRRRKEVFFSFAKVGSLVWMVDGKIERKRTGVLATVFGVKRERERLGFDWFFKGRGKMGIKREVCIQL